MQLITLLARALCPHSCARDPILPSNFSVRSSAGGFACSSEFASRDSRSAFFMCSEGDACAQVGGDPARLAERLARVCAQRRYRWGNCSHLPEFPPCDFGHSDSFVPLLDSDYQITHLAVMPTRAFGFLCNLIYYCTQGDLPCSPPAQHPPGLPVPAGYVVDPFRSRTVRETNTETLYTVNATQHS